MRRVTIGDVAKRAGVHQATVSRALNARTHHQISPETIARVEAAAIELGYVPNAMARGLRTSSSMSIGVVIPDLTNPFFPPIVRGIEDGLSPLGYTALVINTDGNPEAEKAAIASLVARQVDGFIIATGQLGTTTIGSLAHVEIPAVLVNRAASGVNFPLVAGNDAIGMQQAVEHLVDQGHRSITHISGPFAYSTSQVRVEAFHAEVGKYPSVAGKTIEADSLTIAEGERVMDAIVRTGADHDSSAKNAEEPPTAILAGNDLIALGVYRALRKHGKKCPEDFSVIGFNDMAFAEDFSPPLTTVRVPKFDMGVEAARLLLEFISSRSEAPGELLLPVELVVRESTASPLTRGRA